NAAESRTLLSACQIRQICYAEPRRPRPGSFLRGPLGGSMEPITIRCRENGPLVLPATCKIVDHLGNEFTLPTGKETIALCRCGQAEDHAVGRRRPREGFAGGGPGPPKPGGPGAAGPPRLIGTGSSRHYEQVPEPRHGAALPTTISKPHLYLAPRLG